MAPFVQGICIRLAAIIGVEIDLAIIEAASDDSAHLFREVAGTYVLAVTSLSIAISIERAVNFAATELVNQTMRKEANGHTCYARRRKCRQSS